MSNFAALLLAMGFALGMIFFGAGIENMGESIKEGLEALANTIVEDADAAD